MTESQRSRVLEELTAVLESRKTAAADESYVAGLYRGGAERIGRKLGEEALEAVIAGMTGSDQELVREVADLWFHSLVLLCHRGLDPGLVLDELARRAGTSGLVEKASRTDN